MTETVLLAADGSEYARVAAEHAIDLARDRDATLHVLCVVDERVLGKSCLSSAESAAIEAEDASYDYIAEVRRLGEERGVRVEGEYRHGVPDELIQAYANELDADVIVVGEHGDHSTHLGGVRRRLTARCDRDVVVVPAGA